MGFGVTYSLPIILSGLIAKEKGLLIVENPEAHLHPAGQSRMGVFLAWLAGKGVQVLVETHSDHIINGIRRAIAEFKYLDNSSALVHWFGGLEKRGEPERKGMLVQLIEEIYSPEIAYVTPEKWGETAGVKTLKSVKWDQCLIGQRDFLINTRSTSLRWGKSAVLGGKI